MSFSEPSKNPVGWLIAFGMFMVMLYYLSSLNPISPITNSSIANQLGCNTCGPGGTAAGAFNIIGPFGIVFLASFPAIIAWGYVKQLKAEGRRLEIPEEVGDTEEGDNFGGSDGGQD